MCCGGITYESILSNVTDMVNTAGVTDDPNTRQFDNINNTEIGTVYQFKIEASVLVNGANETATSGLITLRVECGPTTPNDITHSFNPPEYTEF